MLHLDCNLDNIDYGSLIEKFLPQITEYLKNQKNPALKMLSNGLSGNMAKKAISAMPKDQVEKMIAEILNSNSDAITQKIEEVAKSYGIGGKIKSVHVSSK